MSTALARTGRTPATASPVNDSVSNNVPTMAANVGQTAARATRLATVSSGSSKVPSRSSNPHTNASVATAPTGTPHRYCPSIAMMQNAVKPPSTSGTPPRSQRAGRFGAGFAGFPEAPPEPPPSKGRGSAPFASSGSVPVASGWLGGGGSDPSSCSALRSSRVASSWLSVIITLGWSDLVKTRRPRQASQPGVRTATC